MGSPGGYGAPAPAQPQGAPGPYGGQRQAAPEAGYVSPIPVQRTHFGHALASEWTKIRSVRSTMWTLGVMLVLVIGIGLLLTIPLGSLDDLDGMPVLGAGFTGLLLGHLCIITLGVLVMSSEYGTGMIRTTLTACPSRGRVLIAKAVVFFVVAFVLTTIATTLVALAHSSVLSDKGGTEPTGEEWALATVGTGLYVALLGLLALAFGALLRHSAGAITAMLGLVLLPLLLALFMQGESLEDIQQALIEYSVVNNIATLYSTPFLESGPQGWAPVGIIAGVTAAALIGAWAALTARDV
ncbi:ABC transporter permease subunit [Streptomyces gobiensis]|nr:ABC transporter permease subunit [Streptomyces gobiensis]UGY95232.1 ABC transporter permease subunit [Streptomyces gobiensis]